jgi:hypothetical protein
LAVRSSHFCRIAAVLALTVCALSPSRAAAEEPDDLVVAERLAEFLRSARSVISGYQDLINDPTTADKGLTGERILAEATAIYVDRTGEEPLATDPQSREERLLHAQMDAIRAVMAENQGTINAPDVGFKGFIPAIFARLVNEKFQQAVGTEARVKVTAPEDLVRNRTARPDEWERAILTEKFATADWPEEQSFSEVVTVEGRPAFRLIVPEYYRASCLSCHGSPRGALDITGYPKEGGKEGDLGAAISVTLFQ